MSTGPMSSGPVTGVPSPRTAARQARLPEGAEGAATAALLRTVVSVVPSPAVVVTADGRIAAVNDAWRQLAEVHGIPATLVGVGTSYLDACRSDAVQAESRRPARAGDETAYSLVRDVLIGRRTRGQVYYRCPEPQSAGVEREWLLVVETLAVEGQDVPCALVTHHPPDVLAAQVDDRAHDGLLLRRLGESGYDLTSVSDAAGVVTWVSPGVSPMLGWTADQIVGQTSLQFLHPEDVPLVAMRLAVDSAVPGRHEPMRFRFRHADGSYRWLEAFATNLLDDPAVGGLVVNARDITERVKAETRLAANEEWQRSILESLSEAVVVADEGGIITQVNGAAVRLFGYETEAQLVGQPTSCLMPPDLAVRHERALRANVESDERVPSLRRDQPLVAVRRDGAHVPIEMTLGEVRGPSGRRVFTAAMRDVSERLAMTRQLEAAALQDPLTGLGNRRLVTSHLEAALRQLGREIVAVALVYVDLDDFAAVNDVRGEHVGDEVLAEVGRRLDQVALSVPKPTRARAARLGGDDFVLVVEVLRTDGAPTSPGEDGVLALFDPVLSAVARVAQQPIPVGGEDVVLHAALGLAVGDDWRTTADSLLRGAQVAMREARTDTGGRPLVYDEAMRHRERRRVADLAALQRAAAEGEFELSYQAICEVPALGEVVEAVTPHPGPLVTAAYAAEALLRWRRPGYGLVSPADFVPLLESSGLIVEVGAWVLRRAALDAARWGNRAWPRGAPGAVSVNVSPRQLVAPGFRDLVQRVLDESGLPASQLVLEVTEEMVVTDRATDVLRALRGLGVRIAIDDFGTGHSSLAYLSSLPADILKLDRAFITRVPESRVDVAVLEAVATLARALDLTVVAEGVETVEQLSAVVAAGISRIQGFLLARPGPLPAARP